MTTTLLKISADLLALQELLLETANDAGEIAPDENVALEAWFNELSNNREEKLDNYAALIREQELRAAALKEEAERHYQRASAHTNLAQRLKQRMQEHFELHGLRRLDTRRYRLLVKANGGKQAVTVREDCELPTEYQRHEIHADMTLIRKALEAGQELSFARLMPRGSHLEIK